MRGTALFAFFLFTAFTPNTVAAEFDGVDQNGIQFPISATPFSVMRNASPRAQGDFYSGFRSGYTSAPLAIRRPSTESTGTVAAIVDHASSVELAASVGLGVGFEAGVGWGAHVVQRGPGGEVATEKARPLPSFGAHDPRLEIAWAGQHGSISLRPFAMIQFPLGRPEALVAESTTRATIGATFGSGTRHVTWAAEASFLYRPSIELGASTWGPQLQISAGALFRLVGELSAGPELKLAPVLTSQRSLSGQQGGQLFPAEVLGTISYGLKRLRLGLSCGTGLPLSRTSSVHKKRKWVRGPSAPVFRVLANVRLPLDE